MRTTIHYCSVSGKQEPAFGGLADLFSPPHDCLGFWFKAHPVPLASEVPVGLHPTPATVKKRRKAFFVLRSLVPRAAPR